MSSKKVTALVIKPRDNQVDTWLHHKRLFVEKRGSDAGKNDKAIPRTTNDEIRQLASYWHGSVIRSDRNNYFKPDRDKASRQRWLDAKKKIDAHMRRADPSEVYPENEWFWQEASYRVASYLDALAFAPSHFELLSDAVAETIDERKRDIANVLDKGDELIDWVKKGALIAGGLVAAALVVPPIVRAIGGRRDRD